MLAGADCCGVLFKIESVLVAVEVGDQGLTGGHVVEGYEAGASGVARQFVVQGGEMGGIP